MVLGKKIIQIVLFSNDYELLQLRLKENVEVDFFVVVSESQFPNLINDNKCKVLLLPDDKKLSDLNFLYGFLREQIPEFLVEFESIFIMSTEDEFIDFDKFEEILKKIKYDYVILKHRVFWWSKKYFSEFFSKGSYLFTSSQFLVNNNILQLLDRRKKQESNFSDFYYENGWSFKYFRTFPIDSKEYVENQFSYKNSDDKLKVFNNQFKVPKFFEEILDEEICLGPKKIFIDSSNIITENLPKSVLYGSQNYEIFIQNYKINEFVREIKKLVSNPYDKIVLKHNNQTYEFDYCELKNKFLSEIINPS